MVYCVRQFRVLLLLELRPRMDPPDIHRMIDEWIWSIVEIITGREIPKYSGNSHPSDILSTTNPKGTGCMWSLTSLKNDCYYYLHFVASFVSPWHFFPWTSGELQAQASGFSTAILCVLCVMFQVVLLCSESVECFLGMASKFFLNFFVTLPVMSVIIGMIMHFMFNIRCIYVDKLVHFSFFSASIISIIFFFFKFHLSY